MSNKSYYLHAERVLEYAPEGPPLRTERDAVRVMEQARSEQAQFIVIPAKRLDPDFFELRTGVAGTMLQKFVTYRFRVAILGDFSELAAKSESLRAFIVEQNRGGAIWFLANLGELETRLASERER
jgi:hypothetical protein